MTHFPVFDPSNAPEASRPVLERAKQSYGFVPNLYGTFAQSPAALEAYSGIAKAYEKTSLTPVERQVVLLSVSAEHACEYCMAAHSTVAQMVKIDPALLSALREERSLPDPKLDALRTFTLKVVRGRGWVDAADQQAFFDAGYQPQHVLDVLTGVALKTLSNYTNHFASTPIDPPFQANAWQKAESAA